MWQGIRQMGCLACCRKQLRVRSALEDAREPREPRETTLGIFEDNLELPMIYASSSCPTTVTVDSEECIGGREQVSVT